MKLKVKNIALYALIGSLLCCVGHDFFTIAPELSPYMEIHKAEAAARQEDDRLHMTGLQIQIDDMPSYDRPVGWPGIYMRKGRETKIIIGRHFYNTASQQQIEQAFLHEIGHVLYLYNHSRCGHNQIMCATLGEQIPSDALYIRYRSGILDNFYTRHHDQGGGRITTAPDSCYVSWQ